jgi:hypothetical protein
MTHKVTFWFSEGSAVTLRDVGDEVEAATVLSEAVLRHALLEGLGLPEESGVSVQRDESAPTIAEIEYPRDMRVFVDGKRVANGRALELVAAGLAQITAIYLALTSLTAASGLGPSGESKADEPTDAPEELAPVS